MLALALDLQAQAPIKEIEVYDSARGLVFSNNGYRLSKGEVKNLLKTNTEAYERFRGVDKTRAITSVMAGTGGFIVGYSLGMHISGKEPNWNLAGVGAGLCLLTVPFTIKYNKEVKAAVKLYNEGLETAWVKPNQKEYILSSATNGLGLLLSF